MGNRSNVFIQQEKVDGKWVGIGFYSHWGGTAVHQTAAQAVADSAGRLGDPSYFARRVIHKLLLAHADPDSETGAGLWTQYPDDNGHSIMVINAITGRVWWVEDDNWNEDEVTS